LGSPAHGNGLACRRIESASALASFRLVGNARFLAATGRQCAVDAHVNWPGRVSNPANETSFGLCNGETPYLSRGGRRPRMRSNRRRHSRRNRIPGSHGNRHSHDIHDSHRSDSPRPSAAHRQCHVPCRTDGKSKGSRLRFLLRREERFGLATSSASAVCPHSAGPMLKRHLREKRSSRQRPMPALRLWSSASA
jgi:hypothetical protein